MEKKQREGERKVHVRTLGLEQIEDVKQMMLDIFTKEPWNDTWTEEQLHRYVTELMAPENALCLGLYEGEQLAGIALGRKKHWYEGTEYWIDELGIHPEKQHLGFGKLFMEQIEAVARAEEIVFIVLQTERTVPAYQFYQRNGFRENRDSAFMVKRIGMSGN